MRRLNVLRAHNREERGATAVTFALLLVPLLAILAFVVDIGLLYYEKAQLQNGADAAALAVAQECALLPDSCEGDASDVASTYSDSNANDGAATASIPEGTFEVDGRSGKVTVRTSTQTIDGDAALSHPLASALGLAPTTVVAEASAVWGLPVAGNTLALTFGRCEFADHEPTGDDFTGSTINISYDVTERRHCGPDEDGDGVADVFSRGAFGWVESSNCTVDIDLADPWVPGTSGANGNSSGCSAELLSSYIGQTVLIPLFDDCRDASRPTDPNPMCNGSDVEYHLVAFAAFHITGIRVPGINDPDRSACSGGCANKTIQGYFRSYVDLADGFELGDSPDSDLMIVRLSG
ncbi:pilus assembly protein TadG-related protein [Agromyces sp. NPDC004153]